MTEEKDVHAIMDEVILHPTLDKFLDRHPRTLEFPKDYEALIAKLRADRAQFIKGEIEKKAKKALKQEEAE